MDADTSPVGQAVPAHGGTVEPARQARAVNDYSQALRTPAAERYEMYDPFAEVTYRTKTFDEMVSMAARQGSSRFVAVAEDGKLTPIRKVDGEWRRVEQHSTLPERPQVRGPARDEARGPADVVPNVDAAKGPVYPGEVDPTALARFDAWAERAALIIRLEAGLQERYIIKRAPVTVGDVTIGRTEYRFRGDTSRVAFTESTLRLATDTNSPSVARSMVDVAQARNWKALRVSGNEEFKRMVWLEASVRGVKALGYEPNPADLEALRRERETRLVNRIEPAPGARGEPVAASADKQSARGGGGRKAVLAAIEAVLVAKKVPEKQREAVMAAATEKLAQRIRDGQAPKVKVYDKAAPSQRPVVMPTPEHQRSRERAAPAPVR